MKIDGNLIAQEIKEKLKKQVAALRSKNILPHLAIVLIGHDPNSLIYIKQKIKVGKEIGVKISNFKFQLAESDQDTPIKSGWRNLKKDKLLNLVQRLNKNESIHGIIIQRPVPIEIKKDELDRLVIPEKDVDGFHPKSLFTPPVALAVIKILNWIYQHNYHATVRGSYAFKLWLKNQRILIIGRGETAGKPIARTFEKMDIPFLVAHSQTTNLKKLCLLSDIIISCVGKSNIVRPQMVAKKSIVIGVGLHGEDDKLRADYNQKEIAKIAAFYTPVPGGVGPVNVACLFENLLKAATPK